uniref:Uncharacterized protein n=1 Tax=Pararge aegeria TaxID=116150 RepID=S4P2X5_9NEOP
MHISYIRAIFIFWRVIGHLFKHKLITSQVTSVFYRHSTTDQRKVSNGILMCLVFKQHARSIFIHVSDAYRYDVERPTIICFFCHISLEYLPSRQKQINNFQDSAL